MAAIRKEILTAARPEDAWSAIRDAGALHTRLVPGFVVDTILEPGARMVTFGNGMKVLELIVDSDDTSRRLVRSAAGGRLSYHNALLRVFAAPGSGSRIVWIADILPDEMKVPIERMIAQGMAAMKKTLDGLANPG